MNSLIPPKTLKSKLVLYFLIITIVPSIIICYFFYRISQSNLEKNMLDTSTNNLTYSLDMIDKQLVNAEQLSDWIFINRNLDDILTKNFSSHGKYNSQIKYFLDMIDYQLRFNTSISTYVYSFIIVGKNGINLRAGPPEGSLLDIHAIQTEEWFKKGLQEHGLKFWYGVIPSPTIIKYESYMLPLVRPVLHSFTNREIGWHMIGFRTALIGDLFKNFQIENDEMLFVVDTRGYCIYNSNRRQVGQDLKKSDYIRTILKRGAAGYIRPTIHGVKRLVVYDRSRLTGWIIVKVLSLTELNRQKRVLFNMTLIIMLSSLVFTSFLTIILSVYLTKPLTKLLQRTKAIATGDFERDPAIESEDELGILGHSVNEMAVNIQGLLNQVIQDEQDKRHLELEMLQYQVNPHFLYNTLNSIKLMAVIQKADGIKEMVTALGRLIMNLSKNNAEKIMIETELSLLEDYVYIQNIRYKGKIQLEYKIESPALLKCKIIKFTLQPIVENAIFHGIEPKKDAGKIGIRIMENGNHLVISIEDDGVGMTSNQIDSILSSNPPPKTRGLSGIGVKNVDERIKLTYGSEYGLAIESEIGQYTKVYLKIPKEEEEGEVLLKVSK